MNDLVMPVEIPVLNILALVPLIIVCITGLIVLVLDLWTEDKPLLGWVSLVGIVLAGLIGIIQQSLSGFDPTFQDVAISDGYTHFFNLIILFTAALSVLVSIGYLDKIGLQTGEYYAILLFSTAGMMIMAAAKDLMLIFLGLETMSIALYILAALNREDRLSIEAGVKYFLMGSFASAFFLYGAALVYGSTGSINLYEIGAALAVDGSGNVIALLGLGLLLIGFSFKIAAVPFHWWTPDVYYGAPNSVTTFMSVGAKAAGFAALVRMLMISFTPGFLLDWQLAIAVLAVLTMTLGNLAALGQKNVKQILAYSGIAHAGYILVGITGGSKLGVSAALFYLFVYTFMNIGAFAIVGLFERKGSIGAMVSDYTGLAKRSPTLAAVMAIFMLSLTGFPPLGGFWGKVYVFQAAVEAGWIWVAVIGVINSGIAAFYYLNIVVQMYFRPAADDPPVLNMPSGTSVALGISAVAIVILGVWPAPILNLTLGNLFG